MKSTREASSHRCLVQFYSDRSVRLYPALVFMVATTLMMHAWSNEWTIPAPVVRAAILSLTYTSNIRELALRITDAYSSTWSLAVEEHFYIFWSLCLPFVVKLTKQRRLLAMVLLFSSSFVFRVLGHFWGFKKPRWAFGYYSDLANFWKMLVGASLRILPVPNFLQHRLSAQLGLLILLTSCLISIPKQKFDLTRLGLSKKWGHDFFQEPIAAVSAVLIILGGLNGNCILECQVLRFIGRVSYSLYLFQVPLLKLGAQESGLQGLKTTCLAFVCATISIFYIEEPLRNSYRAWQNRRNVQGERV